MAKSKKYYVIWSGVEPGIYDNWSDAQAQIKGYPNARYKSFKSLAEAEEAYGGTAASYIKSASGSQRSKSSKPSSPPSDADIIWESLAVDAACSGNPGKMEYQGVDTQTGDRIFHQAFPLGTNNIGEFLALVHGLAHLKKTGSDMPIYTDSKIAMGWVLKKKCNSKLAKSAATKRMDEMVARAEKWLRDNTYSTKVIKWDTDNWGEIPADFGRK